MPVDPRVGRMVLAARDARLPRRGARDRERAVGSRSARPAAREAAGGRRSAPPLPRRALRFPVVSRAVGILRGTARGEALAPPPGRRLPRALRLVPPAHRMARRACAARERDRGAGLEMGREAAGDDRCGALPRDPRGAAGRTPRQHRREGCRRAGLSRRARDPLSPASGLRAREEGAAEMGARGRARRDLAPVRALRGEGRAGVDRDGRGRSRHARVFRAALGRRARRGRRERARPALRAHARAAPPRVVSAASIRGVARDVFIREALVPGALATRGAFLAHNRRLVAEVAELEHKARRQDVLVDDAAIADVLRRAASGGHPFTRVAFERWRRRRERKDPQPPVPHARDADAPRGRARDRGALSRIDRDGRRDACRSTTASRRAIRWTASR